MRLPGDALRLCLDQEVLFYYTAVFSNAIMPLSPELQACSSMFHLNTALHRAPDYSLPNNSHETKSPTKPEQSQDNLETAQT